MDTEKTIREQLLDLLGGVNAHMDFDEAVDRFPIKAGNCRPPNSDYHFRSHPDRRSHFLNLDSAKMEGERLQISEGPHSHEADRKRPENELPGSDCSCPGLYDFP